MWSATRSGVIFMRISKLEFGINKNSGDDEVLILLYLLTICGTNDLLNRNV